MIGPIDPGSHPDGLGSLMVNRDFETDTDKTF